jgi:hypothetical protein
MFFKTYFLFSPPVVEICTVVSYCMTLMKYYGAKVKPRQTDTRYINLRKSYIIHTFTEVSPLL